MITYMDRVTIKSFELSLASQRMPPPKRERRRSQKEIDAADAAEIERILADPNEVPIDFEAACRELGID